MQFTPKSIAYTVRQVWARHTPMGESGFVSAIVPIPAMLQVGNIPNLPEAHSVEIRWSPDGNPYLLFKKFVNPDRITPETG